jgi:hypothetical protein
VHQSIAHHQPRQDRRAGIVLRVQAGNVIPASLITGIRLDLPGQIIEPPARRCQHNGGVSLGICRHVEGLYKKCQNLASFKTSE